jgi:large subunit ribosomal protein L7A
MAADIKSLKNGNVRIGTKQTIKSVEHGEAAFVFVAQDADPRILSRIVQLCSQQQVELAYVDSMRTLGKACGIGVGAAMVVTVRE